MNKFLYLSLAITISTISLSMELQDIDEILETADNHQVKCTDCDLEYSAVYIMLRHREYKHSKCSKCDYSFSTFQELNEHKYNDHGQPKSSPFELPCSCCEFIAHGIDKTERIKRMNGHIKSMHDGEISCSIPDCDESFKTMQDLFKHEEGSHNICTKCKKQCENH